MNKSIFQKITYPGYFLKENARLRLAPRNWKKTPETSYHSSCYSTKLHTKRWFHVEIRQIEQTYAKKNKITFFSFFRIFQIIFTWFLDFWGWFFKKKITAAQCGNVSLTKGECKLSHFSWTAPCAHLLSDSSKTALYEHNIGIAASQLCSVLSYTTRLRTKLRKSW